MVYTYHIFICSSISGHLCGLHVLAMVNSAVMIIRDTGACVFQVRLSPGICSGVGLLDHMVALFLGHRLYLYSRAFFHTSDPPSWHGSVVV